MLEKIIFTLIGALGALLMNLGWERFKTYHLIRKNLELKPGPLNNNNLNLRVMNSSAYVVEDCIAYLTLYNDVESQGRDIEALDSHYPVIVGREIKLEEDRLCWALMDADGKRKVALSIYPNESQALVLLHWPEGNRFWIATELGFSPPRVCLKAGKQYFGTLKLVAKNIVAKEWNIEIDTTKKNGNPVSISSRCGSDFWI